MTMVFQVNMLYVLEQVEKLKCKRVEKVVELYKQGRIQKVLFAGGKNGISSAKNNQTPEKIRKENESISYLIKDNLSKQKE